MSGLNRSLTIRPAVVAEYKRLCELWRGVESLHHQGIPHIFRKPDEGWPNRSAVESLIAGPDSTILVAETNSEIAGFVTLQVHQVQQTPRMRGRRFVMIENMAVDPLRRRRGFGGALLRATEDWAAQRGISVLQLFVWGFNDAAARFYEAEGFVTELRGMARRIANERAWPGLRPIHEVTMATPPLYIVVRLWIRRGLEAEFEAYERKVSRIMARYGGVIERAIRASRASDDRSGEPFEVHVLKFPSRDRYDAYQDDAERRSLGGERADIITKTDILVGTPGPIYGS